MPTDYGRGSYLSPLSFSGSQQVCSKSERPKPPCYLTTIHSHPHRRFPQIFDHLDNKVLLAWFQVDHPKLMVHVFDHSGKDIVDRTAAIAERLCASITMIADYSHQEAPPIRVSPPQPQSSRNSKEFPVGFLVHSLPEETKTLLLTQCVWSTSDIMFEALSFSCSHPPELLFCLSGFTTSDVGVI